MSREMNDEFIDILGEDGKHMGEVKLKSEAHSLGLYHSSVHIWFYTQDHKVLLQKRAKGKDTFPDLWDISVAGHIGAGENPENAALREIKEEIGISVSFKDLEFITIFLAKKRPKPNIFDNEFHYIHISKLNISLENLSLQKDEVSDIKLISIQELKDQLNNATASKKYVPHGKKYYDIIFKAIQEKLAS